MKDTRKGILRYVILIENRSGNLLHPYAHACKSNIEHSAWYGLAIPTFKTYFSMRFILIFNKFTQVVE